MFISETQTRELVAMRTRTLAREEFLGDCFTGAIECGTVGSFYVNAYRWEHLPTAEWYADLQYEDEKEVHHVTIDTIAKGIGVIAKSELREITEGSEAGQSVLHNVSTGERLYVSQLRKAEILLASRSNGEDGDLDVIDYLAILECALFGKVVYA